MGVWCTMDGKVDSDTVPMNATMDTIKQVPYWAIRMQLIAWNRLGNIKMLTYE